MNEQDLVIVASNPVDLRDLVERFPDIGARSDVLVDRRRRERRGAARASADTERRGQDRRRLDVSERLRPVLVGRHDRQDRSAPRPPHRRARFRPAPAAERGDRDGPNFC